MYFTGTRVDLTDKQSGRVMYKRGECERVLTASLFTST